MQKVTLQNDIILLRPWMVGDAEWYVQARDEEVFRWTAESRTLTIPETEAAIAQVNASDTIFGFAIVDAGSRQLLGNFALVLEETDRQTGEVMYWLTTAARGRGIATQAVRLVCEWAFSTLGLERITLVTHRDNLRSQRVAESAGFCRTNEPEANLTPERLTFVLTKCH